MKRVCARTLLEQKNAQGLATRVKDENIENLKIVLEVRKNKFEL